MTVEGPFTAATIVDDASHGPGANTWSNPGNAAASDNAYAAYILSSGNRPSHYLKATDFSSFAIPAGATLNEIKVDLERKIAGSGTIDDDEIKLVKADGSIGTLNKFVDGVDWGAETTVTYTWSESDLGTEGISGQDPNDPDFGVVVSAQRMTGTSPQAQVDSIKMTVTYTEAGGSVAQQTVEWIQDD